MLKEIEFSKLIENDYNPRKRFDDAAMKDLQNSIGRIGLLEPLVVRPVDGGKFEVVCGVRRLKALHALSWKQKVPCNVVKAGDDQAQIFSISENTARHDLTPIEEARAYAGYIKDPEATEGQYPSDHDPNVKDLSERIGVHPKTISRRISLLSLPEDIRLMVENGELLIRPAETIARLRQLKDPDLARSKMKELSVIYKGLSPNQTALANTVKRILEESEKEEKAKEEMLEEAQDHLKDVLESLRGFNVELGAALKEREVELDLSEFGEDAMKDGEELHKLLNVEISTIGSEEFEKLDKEMAEVEVRIQRMEGNIEIVKEEHPERCPFCQAGILLPDLKERAEQTKDELNSLKEQRDELSEERGGLQDLLKEHTKRITAMEAAGEALSSLEGE